MRIAVLHQLNDPYTNVRIKYFLSQGYEVYSIVFPYLGKGQQKPIPGLKVIELKNKSSNRIPLFKRLSYFYRIRAITRDNNIDVLYIVSALNCFYLKASFANYNFLEIEGSDVILAPKKFPFLKYFYRRFWKYADGIIQDSQLAKDQSRTFLPAGKPNEIIGIGVDVSIFNDAVQKGLIKSKYNLGNRPIVFHSRNSTPLYNIDIIIRSIPLVRKQIDIVYLLTGTFQSIDRKTQNFIKAQKLENSIIFCGYLDHETEIKYYYSDADVVLSVPSSDSSPFSVFEAMMTKTPVIVSDLRWLKNTFLPNRHLLTVPVRDIQSLADSIIRILTGKVTLELSEASQIVIDKINMKTENKKLEKFIQDIINEDQFIFPRF